jgi:iron complex outermembrane receptor protein
MMMFSKMANVGFTKASLGCAVSALSLMQAGAACAQAVDVARAEQEQDPAAAESQARGIQDIVVTAQKRETRLQDTPLAVSAIGADFVEKQNVTTAADLTKYIPNLQFRDDSNAAQQNFVIRGIGTGTNSVGVEGSVGIVIDNVVLGREGMGVSGFDDIERIEVLRGPQGTLFGKNASAGVINIVTKQPNLREFRGSVRASYGNYNAYRVSGNVSGPITDNFGFSLSAFTDKFDGYSRNVLDNSRVNGKEQYGARLKFLYKPNDDVDVRLSADYTESTATCCEWSLDKVIPGTLHDVLVRQTGLAQIGPDSRDTVFAVHEKEQVKQRGVSAEVNVALGDNTLTSITAYREWNEFDLVNPDFLPTILQTLNLSINGRKQNQFSQELRLSSPGGKTVNYVLGVFYFDQQIVQTTDRTGFGAYRVGPGDTIINVVPENYALGSRTISEDRTRTYAIFGDGSIKFTDNFTGLFGFRYSHEIKDDDLNRFVAPGAPGAHPGFPPGSFSIRDLTDNKFTYRLGLQYQWTSDIMTYATYSTGHKGKGVDLNPGLVLAVAGVPLPASSHVVAAEDVRNFEIGLRSTLFDRNLQLNISAFHTTFENYQGTAFIPASVTFALQSVPEIQNDGVEVEAIVSPMRYLRLNANAAYIDSRYTDFPNAPCYALQTAAQGCVGGIQDLKGARVPRSPEYSFNVGFSYEPPLSDRITATFNANYSWRDKITFAIDNDPNMAISGYGLLDFSVGLQTSDRKYEVNFFAKNALDKAYRSYMFGQLGGTGNYAHYLGAPATYGVSAAVRF